MRPTDRALEHGGEELASVYASWKRSLRADGRALSERTFETYDPIVQSFIAFLQSRGLPTVAEEISDDDVTEYFAYLRETPSPATKRKRSPTTVAIHDRCIRALFNWAEKRDRVTVSPMKKMNRPHVPKVQKPIHTGDEVRAMLKTCKGRSFSDLRDAALIRLFYDSGLRLSNVAGLRVESVNLDTGEIPSLKLKGGDEHYGRFGPQTAYALDEYLVARRKHRLAHRPELWLGSQGVMTANGIRQALNKRAAKVGLTTSPHKLRHSFVHAMKEAGAPNEVIQETGGWKTRSMVDYYGASGRKQRAEDWYRKNAPGRGL